ncbi:MAG: sigma-E factor negative regulatory protein, partial [Lysobacterales bacterium]
MKPGRTLTELNTESREHLSSFMDGEEGQEPSRFLVRRLGADADLRKAWARYHLIRDCLRHQDGHIAGPGLSVRVNSALSSEPAGLAGARVGRNWLKPVVGMALAASVALIAVLTVSTVRSPGTSANRAEL